MAKRKVPANGVNKSAAIREMLGKDPHTPVKAIVAALKDRGITVHPNLVYLIKSKLSHKKRRQNRERAVEMSGRDGNANPVELILNVKRLATEAGGMRNLKKLVDILAE